MRTKIISVSFVVLCLNYCFIFFIVVEAYIRFAEKREVYSTAIGESSDVHVREDSCLSDKGVSSLSTATILSTQSVRAAVPSVVSEKSTV